MLRKVNLKLRQRRSQRNLPRKSSSSRRQPSGNTSKRYPQNGHPQESDFVGPPQDGTLKPEILEKITNSPLFRSYQEAHKAFFEPKAQAKGEAYSPPKMQFSPHKPKGSSSDVQSTTTTATGSLTEKYSVPANKIADILRTGVTLDVAIGNPDVLPDMNPGQKLRIIRVMFYLHPELKTDQNVELLKKFATNNKLQVGGNRIIRSRKNSKK
jgi:hypothetical protein